MRQGCYQPTLIYFKDRLYLYSSPHNKKLWHNYVARKWEGHLGQRLEQTWHWRSVEFANLRVSDIHQADEHGELKANKGKANPAQLNDILKKRLEG